MAENTAISWCDSTFNPWVGCSKISPACDNCYAEKWAKRSGQVKWGAGQPRRLTSKNNWRMPIKLNKRACATFAAWETIKDAYPNLTDGQLIAQGFIKPRRPRVFCASLADVFDNEVPDEWRYDLFNLMLSTPYLDWLLLTKRIGNAAKMIEKTLPADSPLAWPWPNVWIGATVCNQEEADRDIPKLLEVPAVIRFLSIEPLLSKIDLSKWLDKPYCPTHDFDGGFCVQDCGDWRRIDWVIVGGESGKNARPVHPDWVRSLRDQCVSAGVPFFFKQWGEWVPTKIYENDFYCYPIEGIADFQERSLGKNAVLIDGGCFGAVRLGRKKTGRTLDGVIHDASPGGLSNELD